VNADLEFECCRGFIATDLRAMLNIAGEDKRPGDRTLHPHCKGTNALYLQCATI
jgi:hypothetical protein